MPSWANRPLRTASLVFFDLETTALRPDRGGRIRGDRPMMDDLGCVFATVNREQNRIIHVTTGCCGEQSQISSHSMHSGGRETSLDLGDAMARTVLLCGPH